MATVKGIWVFKDDLTKLPNNQNVNFTSNNTDYNWFYIDVDQYYSLSPCSLVYTGPQNKADCVYTYETYEDDIGGTTQIGWLYGESYRTIDFGETEQTVSDEFYAWIVENTMQAISNIKINITKNGTITLATKGKCFNKDIDIIVSLEDDFTDTNDLLNGEIAGEYINYDITNLKGYAFAGCQKLTSISLPNCKSIEEEAFMNCSTLTYVNLPNCTTIDGRNGRFFYQDKMLQKIEVENLTEILNGTRAFAYCDKLVEFVAPKLTSLEGTKEMFKSCDELKMVSFPNLNSIPTIAEDMFLYTRQLEVFILGYNGRFGAPTLEDSTAFDNTQIRGGEYRGIYVPK